MLLLHGGPGATHEYFEAFDSYFPAAGIEYYYYDQLGSFYSDQPEDPSLWELPRFVEEVEQVRTGARSSDRENFYLLGQSWGGLLAIEYALKYQQNLKGLVISNMMASIPAYNEYAEKVLMPAMDQKVLAEIKQLEAAKQYEDPRYMELLMPNHYAQHILRMPPDQWPEPVKRAFKHLNPKVYVPMQGPSELGASGKLVNWDRTGGPREDHRADAGDRREVRHDGSGAHGEDGEPGEARTLSLLPERQPHGDVRRSEDLLRRPGEVRPRCRLSGVCEMSAESGNEETTKGTKHTKNTKKIFFLSCSPWALASSQVVVDHSSGRRPLRCNCFRAAIAAGRRGRRARTPLLRTVAPNRGPERVSVAGRGGASGWLSAGDETSRASSAAPTASDIRMNYLHQPMRDSPRKRVRAPALSEALTTRPAESKGTML